ncbi:uncharacterized protein [Palaemon carinicauda]|uniref:uncharacterized protein n=1 Tax=Palaemon carinicauda TaxID=392227 RepID=UPI0035B5D678
MAKRDQFHCCSSISILLVMLTTTFELFPAMALASSFYQRYNESSRCGRVIGQSVVHSLTTCAAICSEGSNCSGFNLEVRDAGRQRSCQLTDSWDSCVSDVTFNFYAGPLAFATEASTTAIPSTVVVSADETVATLVITTSALGSSQESTSSSSLTSTDSTIFTSLTTSALSSATPTESTTTLAADSSSTAPVSTTSITTTDTIEDPSTTTTPPVSTTSVTSTATTSSAVSTSSPSVTTTAALPISTTTSMATSSATSTPSTTNNIITSTSTTTPTTTTTTTTTTPGTTSQSTSAATSKSTAQESTTITTTTAKSKDKKTTAPPLSTSNTTATTLLSTTSKPITVITDCPATETGRALVGINVVQGQSTLTLHLKVISLVPDSKMIIHTSEDCLDDYGIVNVDCDFTQIHCQLTSDGMWKECETITVINMEALCPPGMLVVSISTTLSRVASHIKCCKAKGW